MPPTEQTMDDGPQVRLRPRPRVRPRTAWYVRSSLLMIAGLLIAVFVVATQVRPYEDDGTPKRMASHTSLGLPACNFQVWTKMPCPSCGMTTSFAMLVRGDIWNSIRANFVGTGLAVFCLVLIPWSIASAFRGQYYFIRSTEGPLAISVGVFTIAMMLRWGVVMLMTMFE